MDIKRLIYAFDGNINNFWIPSQTEPTSTWIQYQLDNAKVVKQAKITAMVAQMSCVAKIQGSNNGSTWTDISDNINFEQTTETSAQVVTSTKYIKINSSVAYKYFRLQFVSASTQYMYNGGYQLFGLHELQLYGDV